MYSTPQRFWKPNALSKITTNSYGVHIADIFWLSVSNCVVFSTHFSKIIYLFLSGFSPDIDHRPFLIPLSPTCSHSQRQFV